MDVETVLAVQEAAFGNDAVRHGLDQEGVIVLDVCRVSPACYARPLVSKETADEYNKKVGRGGIPILLSFAEPYHPAPKPGNSHDRP